MDFAGLARAVTTYWSTSYEEQISQSVEQLPMLSIAGIHRRIKRALSSRSARAWLLKLSWNWKEVKKGIYKDGHEREDVKLYRNKVFLPRMEELKLWMIEWNEDLTIIPKEYEAGVRPIVFVTHDESTFNSNNGRKRIWVHEDHAPLRKKGRRQGLHVSDFLVPVGRLEDGDVCEILKCGGDTWWTGELMLKQLIEKAIPAFEKSFPGCQGLFAFDNAKNHQKYASDMLRSGNMNLTPGGINTILMRDGWFIKLDDPNTIHWQRMMLADGCIKGLKLVLQERAMANKSQTFNSMHNSWR